MEMKVIGIEEILKRGFSLKWMESHCSLSLYGESGGKCGFDESIALTGLTQLSVLLAVAADRNRKLEVGLGPGHKRYSYADIKKVTNSFNHKLGQGGYGGVNKTSYLMAVMWH
ncbi:hypothetical protein WN943_011815 [Citrus x changshan-huyou]